VHLTQYLESKLTVTIAIAQHKAEAEEQLLRQEGEGRFAALIVDVMLPGDAEDLTALATLDRQRTEAFAKLAEATAGEVDYLDERIAKLRFEIDDLDQQIDARLALEGGCELLERYSDQLHPGQNAEERAPLALPVIVFTARGLSEVRSRCERIVDGAYLRWLEKPVDEAEIADVLRKSLSL
jgi:CheY-like chemotaxis protein